MDEPFDNKAWLESLLANERNDIKLIGAYLTKYRRMRFPSKKMADLELRRNLRVAKDLVENYTPSQIRMGIMYCVKEYVNKWTLETVLHKLPELLVEPKTNNPLYEDN